MRALRFEIAHRPRQGMGRPGQQSARWVGEN